MTGEPMTMISMHAIAAFSDSLTGRKLKKFHFLSVARGKSSESWVDSKELSSSLPMLFVFAK